MIIIGHKCAFITITIICKRVCSLSKIAHKAISNNSEKFSKNLQFSSFVNDNDFHSFFINFSLSFGANTPFAITIAHSSEKHCAFTAVKMMKI